MYALKEHHFVSYDSPILASMAGVLTRLPFDAKQDNSLKDCKEIKPGNYCHGIFCAEFSKP